MLKNTVGEMCVYYCVFIKVSCNPHDVVQILVNEVTQNYRANNTHPTSTGELHGRYLSSRGTCQW